jgi:hypothetical protein
MPRRLVEHVQIESVVRHSQTFSAAGGVHMELLAKMKHVAEQVHFGPYRGVGEQKRQPLDPARGL